MGKDQDVRKRKKKAEEDKMPKEDKEPQASEASTPRSDHSSGHDSPRANHASAASRTSKPPKEMTDFGGSKDGASSVKQVNQSSWCACFLRTFGVFLLWVHWFGLMFYWTQVRGGEILHSISRYLDASYLADTPEANYLDNVGPKKHGPSQIRLALAVIIPMLLSIYFVIHALIYSFDIAAFGSLEPLEIVQARSTSSFWRAYRYLQRKLMIVFFLFLPYLLLFAAPPMFEVGTTFKHVIDDLTFDEEINAQFLRFQKHFPWNRKPIKMGADDLTDDPTSWLFWDKLNMENSYLRRNLNGKKIMITGANSGIGLHTAKWIHAFTEADLLMGCRSENKCVAAATAIREYRQLVCANTSEGPCAKTSGGKIEFVKFDLFVTFPFKLFHKMAGTVDILINNAGFGGNPKVPIPPEREFEEMDENSLDMLDDDSREAFLEFNDKGSSSGRMWTYHQQLQQVLKPKRVVTIASLSNIFCRWNWMKCKKRTAELNTTEEALKEAYIKYANEWGHFFQELFFKYWNPYGELFETLPEAHMPKNIFTRNIPPEWLQMFYGKGAHHFGWLISRLRPDLWLPFMECEVWHYPRTKFWQTAGADREKEIVVEMAFVRTNINERLTGNPLIKGPHVGVINVVKAAAHNMDYSKEDDKPALLKEQETCIDHQGYLFKCFSHFWWYHYPWYQVEENAREFIERRDKLT